MLTTETLKRDAPFKITTQRTLSGTEAETEGDIETWVDGLTEGVAARAAHVALQQTTKGAVNNTVAFKECGTPRASMCCVQQRNQTLVCILLRVPRQRPSGAPSFREQGCRTERGLWRRWCVRGCEEPVEFAACAIFFAFAPSGVMLVS